MNIDQKDFINIINTQGTALMDLQRVNDENIVTIENLLLQLNETKTNSKVWEDESETILIILESILDRNYKKYKNQIDKISRVSKTKIESIISIRKIF